MSKYGTITHRFDFEDPQIMEDALRIDKLNSDISWADIVAKEMYKLRVTFKTYYPIAPKPLSDAHK